MKADPPRGSTAGPPDAAIAAAPAPRSRLKDMGLFLISPLLSLAYALFMPIGILKAMKAERESAPRK